MISIRRAAITRQSGITTKVVTGRFHVFMPPPSKPDIARCSRVGSRKTAVQGVVGLAALIGLIFLARGSAAQLAAYESWLAGLGVEGWVIFVVGAVVLMTVFVPSTVIGAVAGALFGIGWGFLAMTVAGLTTAALTWLIGSSLLKARVGMLLRRFPKMQAIQRAVMSEGASFQFMLRLAPINAVATNYVLGAAGVRFAPFMVGALGMLAGFFVEVYFGHLARHVSRVAGNSGSIMETAVRVAGFVVCVGVIIAVGKMARKAIAKAEERTGGAPPGVA